MKLYNKIFLVVTLIGLVDALYLSYIKLSHTTAACLPGVGNCEVVNTSVYSQVFGIPIAYFGALAYLALLGIVLLEARVPFLEENANYMLFTITLVGVLYSAYLTYLEIDVIRAICPFCVVSAIAMLILFALCVMRLVRSEEKSTL